MTATTPTTIAPSSPTRAHGRGEGERSGRDERRDFLARRRLERVRHGEYGSRHYHSAAMLIERLGDAEGPVRPERAHALDVRGELLHRGEPMLGFLLERTEDHVLERSQLTRALATRLGGTGFTNMCCVSTPI